MRLASVFIWSVKDCSVPAMHSARTTDASFPDKVTMPLIRFSTLTCSLALRNIVEPAWGPCHFCQVSGRTVHILLSGSWPLSISSNATSVVIILAIDAGGMRVSVFFEYSSAPEDRSIRYATLAGVSNCGAAAGDALANRSEAAEANRIWRVMGF